jgi:PAS domain S-box-containing protein
MAGAVLSNLRDAVSGKKAVNFELECKKTDRILSAAAHSFEKGVAACVLTDITDIKKAEREKAKLTAAIEQTGEAVIITGRDGSVEYVNPSFERSSGLSRERVTGRSISMFKSGGSGADFMESALLPAARDGVWRGRVTGRRSDGVRLEEDLTVSPIRDSSGSRISNYVIVSRDVTEQVKFERHLRQTQKLNAIGSLAGGIAHDFNNILTAIMGYTQMSMELSPPDSDVRKYLETILKAGGRAKSLIKQILTFSRKTGGKAVFVKPSAIIAEVTELVKSTAPANIQISLSSSSDAEILADPTELHQVFMNLCSNAIHAMRGKGGTLGVSVESVRLEEGDMPVEMREMPAGVYVRMSFRDTGCGMPSEVLERIFEPFFSTKDQSESTGMGLSVVHGIVKGMGGKIAVKSEVGAGSLFQIYVPGAGSVPDVERIVSKAAALSASVLIAGRTDDFVRAAAALCSEAGHRPVAPPSGVRDPGDIPKNLLGECDVVLAENFDGISAAVEKIHAGRTDLPVIIPLPAGAEKPVPGKEGLVFHTDWPAGVAELRAAVRRALESAILDA